MFHHRKELNVRVSHLLYVGDQVPGQLAVREGTVPLLRDPPPRSQVDLVDRHRAVEGIRLGPLFHPGPVVPPVLRDVVDDGGGLRADFRQERVRVGLDADRPAAVRPDLELVERSLGQAGDEYLPDAGRAAEPHLMDSAVPVVEAADQAHASGVRRPDGEMDARGPVHGAEVGAELLVCPVVLPFADQVQVEVGEDRRESVRILNLRLPVPPVDEAETVGARAVVPGKDGLEETLRVLLLHRDGRAGVGVRDDEGFPRVGPEDPDADGRLSAADRGMRAEDLERVPMLGVDDPEDLVVQTVFINIHLGRTPFRTTPLILSPDGRDREQRSASRRGRDRDPRIVRADPRTFPAPFFLTLLASSDRMRTPFDRFDESL